MCIRDRFYLTAPLDQAENVSATFSSKMKGSIDKEYSAYKITTGSGTQDLALVFGEGVGNEKYVDFKVTWTKECKVSIVKKDQDTGNALAGAVYGIYSDAAYTKLIAEMPATDQNGASQLTMEKTQEVVYLKEISVPTGYQIDTKSYNVTLAIGKTTTKNVTDKRVNAKINIAKQDAETGNAAQGDATLEGAVYGLYAREDIVHPDGRTGTIHKKDSLITSLTTDKNGEASVSDLYLGKYYLKELSAPVGYVLDPTEHEVDCIYEGATVPTVERTSVCKETVIKQPFQIIKAANNGKTDADLLQGVGFSAWLVSDLKVKADGSYDFDSARPVVLTADGQTEMFTDEKGYARSIPLPYGTYVVRETTSKHNYAPVDDFIVKITENHPDTPQTWRVLLDKEFKAKLKIIKKDAETQKSVLLANTEFKVYDLDNQKYVEQTTSYPKPTVHKSYFTNEEGYLVLPRNLKPGNYRIEEVTAPDGYTISKNYVTVKVDSDTAYLTDPVTGDVVIDVEYTNVPVKGQLKIYNCLLYTSLKTLEQKQALRNILEYCDETTLKVPFIMGIGVKIAGGIAPETRTADEMIAYYRDMSESKYEKLKEMVKKGAKMKTGIMKYHPSFIAQRKMQKEFQDKGYNDIFIPNLMVLSPQYAEYKKALDKVNDRMCRELGLHYDSDYNLVIKNLE